MGCNIREGNAIYGNRSALDPIKRKPHPSPHSIIPYSLRPNTLLSRLSAAFLLVTLLSTPPSEVTAGDERERDEVTTLALRL